MAIQRPTLSEKFLWLFLSRRRAAKCSDAVLCAAAAAVEDAQTYYNFIGKLFTRLRPEPAIFYDTYYYNIYDASMYIVYLTIYKYK